MTAYNNPRLITPPKEEEEIYPYRRVWRSYVLEGAILTGITVILFVAGVFFGIQPPRSLYLPVNIVLALLPMGLWLVFSRWAESRVLEPRRNLLTVFVISLLVAQAVGVPLVEDFWQPERWLALESAVNRILGYIVTIGITQELLKYLVLRYTVGRSLYRIRTDSIAYSVAAALGYATILNLHFVFANQSAPPDVTILRVYAFTVIQLSASLVVSYGIAETMLGKPPVLLQPITVGIGAALSGIAIPLRAGLVNATLSLDGGATRPLLGLGFGLALWIVPAFMIAFLYRAADQRDEDIVRGEG